MKFNNKKISKILACFACVLTIVGVTLGNFIFAADDNKYDLIVTSKYDDSETTEVPLTMDVSTTEFYFNANINPGDTLEADILMKNDSDKETLQVTISEILNLLGDDDDALDLLDELILTLEMDGRIIYQGPHSKTTTPVVGWVDLPAGGTISVHISVYFPKEADNRFQNAPMKVKYIFESRIDIPEPEDTPPPETVITETTETVKTGLDDTNDVNYAMIIVGVGVCLVVIYLIILLLIKRKKDEEKKADNQKNE